MNVSSARPTARRRSATNLRLAGAATLLGVLATGCGGGVVGADSGSTSAPDSATEEFTPATGGSLSIYTWSDYFPTDLLQQFEEETGIKTTIDFYENNEAVMTKLEATGGTGYDIVVPSDYAVKALIDKGLALQINTMSLPNAVNIDDSALDPYYDPDRLYSAPFMYGTTGYAYDSALLANGEEGPDSWADYFDPSASFAGKVGILNDEFDAVNAALRAVGAPTCTDEPEDLQAALDLLLGFKDSVKTISSDATPDRLASGENSMGMIWNGDAHRAWVERDTLVYVYPTEGISSFEDNWLVPSGAENVDQALTFINWMLEPENAAAASNYVGFNSQIIGAEEFLAEDMREDPAIVAPADAKVELVEACPNATMNKYTQIWETFKG